MPVAAIDIGSNSVLLLVAERLPDGRLDEIEERMEITRLSQGIGARGELREEARERTARAVAAFVARARELGAGDVKARGTAGLRNATNPEAFIARVRDLCGVEVEVITGDEEARCGYLAGRATAPPDAERVVVVDIGGASTELTFGVGEEMVARMSLPVGAVRLTEAFLPSDPARNEELVALDAHLREKLVVPAEHLPVDAAVGIAGTFTDLAAVHQDMATWDPQRIEGTELDAPALDALVELFQTRTIEERKAVPGLHPKRADVILAGTVIARRVQRMLNSGPVRISRRGLRHGLLL